MSELLHTYHDWIQWVLHIDSGKKWPIIGITACTHGWETVWLEIIDYLLNTIDITKNLIQGEIYLILSNIKAYEKSLELKAKWDPEYIINARYIEENMNRCCSVESLNNPINYERQRANELTKILKKLEYHFDIHSTMNPSWSMFIHTEKSEERFKNIFNTDETYINLPETVVGKPLLDITERNGGMGMAIETWNQTNKDGYKVGIDNVLRLLSELKMIDVAQIDQTLLLDDKANEKYHIVGSVFIETEQFIPAKEFNNLEVVKKWEIIAHDWDKIIYAEDDYHIIMPSSKHSGEEYCFLAKKTQ